MEQILSLFKLKWLSTNTQSLQSLITVISLIFINVGCGNWSGSSADSSMPGIDTTAPAPPTITSPASRTYASSASLFSIVGACEFGATVIMSGDATGSTVCTSGAYNFSISKSQDGNFSFSLLQKDLANNLSLATVQKWTRDTSTPLAPSLVSPLTNPYTSGDTSLVLRGFCELNATVNLSGASVQTANCTDSGTFAFTLSESSAGTYAYTLIQTDRAGNASPSLSFTWQLDTSVPASPVLTSPTSNPHYSNATSVSLIGTCTNGFEVGLAGNSSQTATCASSSFSFTVNPAIDGTYQYHLTQTDPSTEAVSGQVAVTWIRDTAAPSAPVKTSPTASPSTSSDSIVISGTCEALATVLLSGDDAQNLSCSSGQFSFTVLEASDGTYNYDVAQRDLAGNTSASFSQTWIKDSSVPSTPTILTPSSNPFSSNSGTLTLSGGCQTGFTVTLSGEVAAGDVTSPNNSLTQICSNNQYSYTIVKSVSDVYALNLKQTNLAAIDSSVATLEWNLDTVVPETTLATTPTDPNLSTTARFTFTSDDPTAQFECKLDSGSYAACVSPLALTSLTNASHTLSVRAKDAVENVDATPATYTWVQTSGNTVALYHFDTGTDTTDSGIYGNGLTNNSATLGASGVFNEAIQLNGTSHWMSGNHSDSLAVLNQTVTIEARIMISVLPAGSSRYVIAAKTGASPQLGWEFGFRRISSTGGYKLYFIGSANGTSSTEATSFYLSAGEATALTSGFRHVAVTFNNGSVRFFLHGVDKGTKTLGTITTLHNNTGAGLSIGRVWQGGYFNGYIDEVRLSQNIRWSAPFTPAASAYTAD